MGSLEFIFTLLFIVLGSCTASDCDHMALNVCQNVVKEMHQSMGVNDMKGICEKFRASTECFQDFVHRCFEGVEKDEQFAKLTAGMPNMAMICQEDSSSTEKLERLQCLQKEVSDLEKGTGPCTEDMLTSQELKGDPRDEESLKKACCAFSRYQKCWKNVLTEKCGKMAYSYAMVGSKDEMKAVETACNKYDCSGSDIMSKSPVWLMTALVALQILLGQN